MNPAACDIIIPVWNKLQLTRDCLDSIYPNTPERFNLIIIDNASNSETKSFLRNFKSSHDNVFLIENEENLGWVKAVNQGLRLSLSPFICLMNNDTLVRTNGWLSEMIRIAGTENDIGLVNPCFEIKKCKAAKGCYTEMDFCRGHCLLIKRAVIDRIGMFDEAFGIGYNDDDDFSIRAIRAGFRCVMANNVVVEHIRESTFLTIFSQKRISEFQKKNKQLLAKKWGRRLRLVFIISHVADVDKISALLFTLARRQHKINVWNLSKPLGLEHTSIMERLFPSFCPPFIFSLMLYFNRHKKKPKRYDLIFSDDKKFEKDPESVIRIVDSMSLER